MCLNGAQCSRPDCYFDHPPGRILSISTPKVPQDGSNVIVVGRLDKHDTTKDHMFRYFSKFGEVLSVRIKEDFQGQSRGLGFVVFREARSVSKVAASRHELFDVKLKDAMDRKSARTSRVTFK